ncbi:MAG: radical SAM protein, partial [Candidatus Woesearchaeota archaeon]
MGWLCRDCGNRKNFLETNSVRTYVSQDNETSKIKSILNEYMDDALLSVYCSRCKSSNVEWLECEQGDDYLLKSDMISLQPVIPKSLHVLLTNKCCFGCSYCYLGCSQFSSGVLKIGLLEKLLAEGISLGIRTLVYTGGEPLIYPHLHKALGLASRHGYRLIISTNAWDFGKHHKLFLQYKVGVFVFGLDGAFPKTHDAIKQTQGSFQKVMDAIKWCKEHGIAVGLHITLQKGNFLEYEDYLKLALSLNLDQLLVGRLIPVGGGDKDIGLLPSEEDACVEITKKYIPHFKGRFSHPFHDRKQSQCSYLTGASFCVDWNGRCNLSPSFLNLGLDYPPVSDTSLIDCIRFVDKKRRLFSDTRNKELCLWRPEQKYVGCDYCIEKIKSENDPLKFFAGHKSLDGDLLLTTACPVECDFCVYSCAPKGEWMPEPTIRMVSQEYSKNDIGIRVCGGEPFYDLAKLDRCLEIVLECQNPHQVLIITSGFFGNNKKGTEDAIGLLRKHQLDTLVVSFDRFHLKAVPLSSVVNIIKAAKAANIKVFLRVTTDEKGYGLMDKIAEIVVTYDVRIEPHESYGVYGKAELLPKELRDNADRRRQYLRDRILDCAARQGKCQEIRYYESQSPKRSQRKFASRFFPTTFPNGNVYADSQCCKGSFMGNINEECLSSLISKFSKTLPGSILLSGNSECHKRMPAFLAKPD